MNACLFVGRLPRDIELRYLANGTALARFSLEVKRAFAKKDGSEGVETVYVPCEIWDSGAERLKENFKGGDVLCVEAQFKTDRYKDKDGNEKRAYYFRVNNFSRPVFGGNVASKDRDNESVEQDGAVVETVNEGVPF